MPRPRTRKPEAASATPRALLDVDDATWQEVAATDRWLRRHSLPPAASWWADLGPATRHAAACELWALTKGLTRAPQFPGQILVNRAEMRRLGIPPATRQPLLERLLAPKDQP